VVGEVSDDVKAYGPKNLSLEVWYLPPFAIDGGLQAVLKKRYGGREITITSKLDLHV